MVGIEFDSDRKDIEGSMIELQRLAETAGASVAASITQKRNKPDLTYFIGTGKAEDLKNLIKEHSADLVIFDNDLRPSQLRNLEELLGLKVVDRTELILDIFAQHAMSHEGRLQVELAQSQYQMTRLLGKGIMMSRLGGGIGTRGPGETKLEEDRRRIRKKISELKKEIEKIRDSRSLRRNNRKASGIKIASIIGYTNAGKSSLLNVLTDANVEAHDKLFATLDTTTRKLYLDDKNTILLSDTVGFIQKLPHQLVDAFRATLEEVNESDLLLHVVDASSPYFEDQIDSVYKVLEEIGAISKPIITIFNKTDLLQKKIPQDTIEKFSPSVEMSCVQKKGIKELKDAISSCLQPPRPS